MEVNILKVLYTGDFLVDNKFEDETIGIDSNFPRWTDMVAKELEFEYINEASEEIEIDEIATLSTSRVSVFKPSHVILNGGINDIKKGTPVDHIVNDLEFLSIVLYESSIDMVYVFIPIDFKGIDLGSMYNTMYSELRRKLIALFDKYGDKYIDLSTILGGVGNVKSTAYLPDKVHQNQNGQMLIAREVSEKLRGWYGIK